MCHPIIIGAAIGAATSAITGQDPLLGAVIGGVTGGMGGLEAGGLASQFGKGLGLPGLVPTVGIFGSGVSTAAVVGGTAFGLAGGMAMNMLTPQQQSYNQSVTGMPYTPQAYNTQHAQVTGSGGRQAAAVLASEMKKAKSLRQRQAGVADYGLGMDVTGTGLQIA